MGMRAWHFAGLSVAVAALVLWFGMLMGAQARSEDPSQDAPVYAAPSKHLYEPLSEAQPAEDSGHGLRPVKVKPFSNSSPVGGAAKSRSRPTASSAEAQAPSSGTYDAADLLKLLRAKGLPIGSYVNYTARTDENHLLGRQGEYVRKVNFTDKRIPSEESAGDPTSIDAGGSIETFANTDDAERRFQYVKAITQSVQVFAEYDYLVGGTVLLRLSNVLTPTQAAAYERELERVVAS